MTISEKITQASAYEHLKTSVEFDRIGEHKKADNLRKIANELSVKLNTPETTAEGINR